MVFFRFLDSKSTKEKGFVSYSSKDDQDNQSDTGELYIKELNDGKKVTFHIYNNQPQTLPDRTVFWMHLSEFNACKNNIEKMIQKIQERYELYHNTPLERAFAKKFIDSYDIKQKYVWFHL